METNSKKKISITSILFYIYLTGVIGFTLLGPDPYYRKCTRGSARDKACYSNIRVIQGAVEMYNMDHPTMMTTLDQNILISGKYIKSNSPLQCPETSKNGTYYGDDLTGEGYIYCDYHGDLAGTRPDLSKGPPLSSSEKRREEIDNYIKKLMERFPYALCWPALLALIGFQIMVHR